MVAGENLHFIAAPSRDLVLFSAHARSLAPTVSAPMRRILELILERPADIGGLDAREVAERTGSSSATVVRTARRLGYGGYREMRLALTAMTAAAPRQAQERVIGDIEADDDVASVINKLARDEQDTVHATARSADPDVVDQVAARIVAAGTVHLFGVVASGLVAVDFAGKLNRIGIRAVPHTEGHEALTAAVLMGPDDLAIGISSSGCTADVLEAVRQAQRHGAGTVAISTDPRSPLAGLSELVLVSVVGRESQIRPAALSSRISQLFLIDAVFIRVVQLTYARSSALMHATHEALLGRRRHVSPVTEPARGGEQHVIPTTPQRRREHR